jgi:competence protein ComEA
MLNKIMIGLLLFVSTSLMAMNVSDLNKASKEDLMAIKGIGEAKAEAIIKARDLEKFKSVDGLVRVKGIGQAIVENVKNDVMSAS